MKIKLGVVGADPQLRVNFIYGNFPREKGELTAVCDRDPEVAKRLKEAGSTKSN